MEDADVYGLLYFILYAVAPQDWKWKSGPSSLSINTKYPIKK